jgi:DNA polymerase III delta subunit
VKSIVTVSGPRDAGPGERELMLSRARAVLEQLGADDVTRVDVPGRGSGDATSDSGIRGPVQAAIPALQSGSLFGGTVGLLVVDAQSLVKAEAEALASVVAAADAAAVVVVFVAAGTIPAPLGKTLKSLGEAIEVKRLNERNTQDWVRSEARTRGVSVDQAGVDALVRRFGTDVASIGNALDQLAAAGEEASVETVAERFKNRPQEPSWHYMDAVSEGKTGEALRRLEDFLLHDHPLVLLAAINNDLRRRSLAAAAPDYDTFASLDGGRKNYGMEKVWKQRHRARDSNLRLAIDAVARADLTLKTMPEPTHRVTMERLTVALCRWYGG